MNSQITLESTQIVQQITVATVSAIGAQGAKGDTGFGIPAPSSLSNNDFLKYDATQEEMVGVQLGTAAESSASDFATSAQGQLADIALQPSDNISQLTNDANYIDSAGAPVQSVDGFTGTVNLSGEYDALGSASQVQSALTQHENATTGVHGIADTSDLIIEGDARLSDTRTPTDGSVTDAKIQAGGLSPASVTGVAVIDSDSRLSDERVPEDESVTDAKIASSGLSPSSITGTAVIDSDARLTDQRTPLNESVTSDKIASAGLAPTDISGTAVIDSDARLSDERTPLDASVTDAKVAANANIAQSKISGLETALSNKANLVAGKVPQSELPAIALTEVFVVADIAERDALTSQEGDVSIVQDTGAGESASYIYDGTAWQELLTPTDGIATLSVTGPIASSGGSNPTISLEDLGVTEAKIANGSITDDKIVSGGLSPSQITGTAVIDSDARLAVGAPNVATIRQLGTGANDALAGDTDIAGLAPVQSVNTQTGDVTLDATSVGALPDTATLNSLSNVVITTPQAGDVLQFDGTNWVNVQLTDATQDFYTVSST